MNVARADNASVAPGAWLRLGAVASALATGLVVASGALHLGLAHGALVAAALPLLLAVAIAARASHPSLWPWAIAALGLVVANSAAGGAIALAGKTPALRVVHIGLAALALAAALVAAATCFRADDLPAGSWRDYVILTKPRIMSLLLLTAGAGMFAGARGVPALGRLAAVLAGGALASGGASALNHFLDRDIDGKMGGRTANRPLASGRLAAPRALEFGLVLSAFAFVLLASVINLLTALLAAAGTLGYVVVYTSWLKRSTPQNIVIGGAAGAIPPLVGWAAARGDLTVPAFFLFLIVFFWTPPHFWALALLIKREYAAAGIPMLPVVRGDHETARQILRYSLVLAAVTALPYVSGGAGGAYLAVACLLDGCLLGLAYRLWRDTTRARAGRLFHFSLLYLALLFVALAVDPLIG